MYNLLCYPCHLSTASPNLAHAHTYTPHTVARRSGSISNNASPLLSNDTFGLTPPRTKNARAHNKCHPEKQVFKAYM